MKNLAIIITAALAFATAASSAMADGTNYYGAVDIGQTKAKDACTDNPLGVVGCEDNATAFRFAGGYQFGPMWGAEVSYGAYGKASMGSLGGISADWEVSGFQVSGTGTFPLDDAFSLIAKLGIASTELKLSGGGGGLSATSTNLAFGFGAQYDFTQSVSVRAQYEDFGKVGDDNTTGTSNVSLLSAGVVFKF